MVKLTLEEIDFFDVYLHFRLLTLKLNIVNLYMCSLLQSEYVFCTELVVIVDFFVR